MTRNPDNPLPNGCARESSERIDRLHPMTKIKHLREYYGAHFANGWDDESTLSELLRENNFKTLAEYVRYFRHHPVKRHDA
jgi:hypothetical protein